MTDPGLMQQIAVRLLEAQAFREVVVLTFLANGKGDPAKFLSDVAALIEKYRKQAEREGLTV